MPRRRRSTEDLSADPFLERASGVRKKRLHVLGGRFQFESDSAELLRLVDAAYAGLPRHKLHAVTPDFRIRLVLHSRARAARLAAQPPPVQMMSGAGMLCGMTEWSDSVVISPDEHAALVVVSR